MAELWGYPIWQWVGWTAVGIILGWIAGRFEGVSE